MTLQAIEQAVDECDQVLALVRAGLPISARELATVLRVGISQFYKREKAGAYEDLLLKGAIGVKRYSGVLVNRFLSGEPVEAPVFGRKRAR